MSHRVSATNTRSRPWSTGLVLIAVIAVGMASEPALATGRPAPSSTRPALTSPEAVARAEEWVQAKLQYCQAPNGADDSGDHKCARVCRRQSNPKWDRYRSDCSGLVSYAWAIPSPGRTTLDFAPWTSDVSYVIDAADLRAGDAVNNADHIMLFKEWIDRGKRATFIEEPGCSSSEPYAHELTANVQISGSTVYVAGDSRKFIAIRSKLLTEPGQDRATGESVNAPKKPEPPRASSTAPETGGVITPSQVIERARDWLTHANRAKYDSSRARESLLPDVDRAHHYGRDGSGMVSMAWHLDPGEWGGRNVTTLMPLVVAIEPTNLEPGDVLVYAHTHVVLFNEWAPDHKHFSYFVFASTGMELVTGATLDGDEGRAGVLSGHPARGYGAYRYRNIENDNHPARREGTRTAGNGS